MASHWVRYAEVSRWGAKLVEDELDAVAMAFAEEPEKRFSGAEIVGILRKRLRKYRKYPHRHIPRSKLPKDAHLSYFPDIDR